MKVHFIGVARSPETIKEMQSVYITSLFNTLGGEWGIAEAREATNPAPWMDAKHIALVDVCKAGYLTAREAFDCTVVITNE